MMQYCTTRIGRGVCLALLLGASACREGSEAPERTPPVEQHLAAAAEIAGVSAAGPWGEVTAPALDASGRLFVVDGTLNSVSAFTLDGTHVWSRGREGAGPGEFRTPLGAAVDASGQVWVPDSRTARYTVFSPDGELVGEWPRALGWERRWQGVFLDDGRLLENTPVPSSPESNFFIEGVVVGRPTELDRDTLHLPWYEAPVFPRGWRLGHRGDADHGARLEPTVPMAPRFHWAAAPGGLVWSSHGGEDLIVARTLAGDTVRRFATGHRPPPIPREAVDSAIDDLRRRFPSHRRALQGRHVPDHYPHLAGLSVDRTGALWIQRSSREHASVFDVFSRQGRACARLVLDRALEPWSVVVGTGALAGVAAGTGGAPVVVTYRHAVRCTH